MKILVIGFEPGRENSLHQVRIAVETVREVVKDQFDPDDNHEEVDVVTYCIEGGLSFLSSIYAKAQIEVLNPDAVLFVTGESKKGFRVVQCGDAKKYNEDGGDDDEERNRTLAGWMMNTIKEDDYLNASSTNNIKVRYDDFEAKYKYINQLQCYCHNAIGWIRLPLAPKQSRGEQDDNSYVIESIKVVIAGFNGVVAYLTANELRNSTKVFHEFESKGELMHHGFAMFSIKNKITKFTQRSFSYDPDDCDKYLDRIVSSALEIDLDDEEIDIQSKEEEEDNDQALKLVEGTQIKAKEEESPAETEKLAVITAYTGKDGAVSLFDSPTFTNIRKIQRVARKRSAQRSVDGSHETALHVWRAQRREMAITKIQKNWRGYYARCDLDMKQQAAIFLQHKMIKRSGNDLDFDESFNLETEESLNSDDDEEDARHNSMHKSSLNFDDIDEKIKKLDKELLKAHEVEKQKSLSGLQIGKLYERIGMIENAIRNLRAVKSMGRNNLQSYNFETIQSVKNKLRRSVNANAAGKRTKRQVSCETESISSRIKLFEKANDKNPITRQRSREQLRYRYGRKRGTKKGDNAS